MTDMPTSGADGVIDYLKTQHTTIRVLFTKTLNAGDITERRQHFTQLRAALTAHEVSEELLVHPRVRGAVARTGQVVESLRAEVDETNEQLKYMTCLDPASAEFEAALVDLQQAMQDHTQRVEIEEFPLISDEFEEGGQPPCGCRVDDHLAAARSTNCPGARGVVEPGPDGGTAPGHGDVSRPGPDGATEPGAGEPSFPTTNSAA
jgi:hypothetical protein